ncbi:cysteine peptidase family C39 domain-containing protein [Deinococcus sp.]|uniref:cysteine peptidase family C39 domain-containing protein n=1 Tax=Deinococcus sp. TaxID=47478 RepID=UPI0025C3FA27|nr:cysteine peptidase family C39 domain-containing protein [Deinococcus sp.]
MTSYFYKKYLVKQIDQTDCGAACLSMVLKYWGRREALYTLRDLAGTTQSGTTMAGLKKASEILGLRCKAVKAKRLSEALTMGNVLGFNGGTRSLP